MISIHVCHHFHLVLGNSAALKQLRNIYLVLVHTGGSRINLYSSITVDFNKLTKLEHTVFSYISIYIYIYLYLYCITCNNTFENKSYQQVRYTHLCVQFLKSVNKFFFCILQFIKEINYFDFIIYTGRCQFFFVNFKINSLFCFNYFTHVAEQAGHLCAQTFFSLCLYRNVNALVCNK